MTVPAVVQQEDTRELDILRLSLLEGDLLDSLPAPRASYRRNPLP